MNWLDEKGNSTMDVVILEAQDRFEKCAGWYANQRMLYREDVKFANADSDNGWQWPNDIRKNRDLDEKPCLTINKTAQHNQLITNEMKMNLPGIKYSPVGNGASYESGQIWNALARHIENQSHATDIYSHAIETQVEGGVGYWRVTTDFADDESFEQEIYLEQIFDPLTVMLDMDAREADKSDMKYAFIWDDIPTEQFNRMYPQYKDLGAQNAVGSLDDWFGKDKVRRCEYFRVKEVKDLLLRITTDGGEQHQMFASELPSEAKKEVLERETTVKRKITRNVVEWFFIVGNKIIEKGVWAGSTIPIVQIVGKEVVIDGQLDIRGHTRAMKDPQRIYNYWSSTAVEYGALQTKTPWIAPAQAIEGLESYWNNANRDNAAILPYNGLDDAGNAIPRPERIQPPISSPVALDGMKIASDELEAVSGQYAAQKGQLGNERSANTLMERQKQSDKANYHFVHNVAVGIRYTGRIIMELVPKIYDTERVFFVTGEDGVSFEIKIDPSMQEVYQQEMAHTGEVVNRVLNPKLGKYQVVADVGPAYATRREEAFEAFKLMLSQNPGLTTIIGDILFRAGDFPMAEEAAMRLRRMVPPQALGQGPSQGEQQLEAQLQQVTQVLKNVLDVLSEERIKSKSQASKRDIDSYRAITDRIKALTTVKPDGNLMDASEAHLLVRQLVVESSEANMDAAQDFANTQLLPKVPVDNSSLFGG